VRWSELPEQPNQSDRADEVSDADQVGLDREEMRRSTGRDDEDAALTAASSALARAREIARAKGLRPGSRPRRSSWVPGDVPRGASGPDARDPARLGEQLERLLLDRGWSVDVAVGAVIGRWSSIVGADVAAHCQPTTFEAGVLTVRAESTAWATQLRLMSATLLHRLEVEVGDAVTDLRVVGPSAPSWSRGRLRSEGPGPRDTYG